MDKDAIKKKGGLGRGLSAILRDNDAVQTDDGSVSTHYTDYSQTDSSIGSTNNVSQPRLDTVGSIASIPTTSVETNPYQPRTDFEAEALQELAESIKVQGIIQPITVRQLAVGQYQLISGERRLQASKLAGLESIPAYIRTANDQQMLEMALIENIQRENLNPIEIALSYQRLISEINLKQEELGDRVGKKRTTVNNYLRLLRLPPDIQAGLRDKKISMGHARALVNVEQIDVQLSIYSRILTQDLSVRKVEELVRQLHFAAEDENTKAPKEPTSVARNNAYQVEVQKVQQNLSTQLSTRVLIKEGPNQSGEIKIPFANTDDLNRILELISYQG